MGQSVIVVCSFLVLASLANAVPVDHRHDHNSTSSSRHLIHRHHNSTATRTANVVVNATTVPEHQSNFERHGRQNYPSPQNVVSERFIDAMDVLKPVAGFINGDFGSGLIEPSIPFAKKDDGSAAAAVAAAFSPVEPLISPFRPYAMYYTGATAADIVNLNPQKDLVYPFLDPPKNVLLHIKDEKDKDKDKIKFRDIDGSLESMMGQASRLTSEQQLAYQQALEAWKQSQIADFQRKLRFGVGGGVDLVSGPLGLGGIGGVGPSGLDLSPFGPLGLGVTGPAGLAGLGVPGLGVPGFGGFGAVPGAVPGVYNPLVSPFYPFAYYYTGASPADFNGLNNADLLYPFLDPPLNVLGAIKDKDKKDKDKIKFRIPGVAQVGDNIQVPPSPNARPINLNTPQAVSAVVKDLAAKQRSAQRGDPTTRIGFAEAAGAVAADLAGIGTLGLGAGAGAAGLVGLGALGAGAAGLGPLPGDPGVNFVDKDALVALSPLSTTLGGFRPLSDFVYPFLPADKNPFLSLLYYITPAPLRTASRMNKADNLIASTVAARNDLTPYQAVGLAQSLKEVVAAAELNHMLRSLGLGDASSALIQSFAPVASQQTRQSVIGTLNALGLNPFEDLIDDVFDGGKKDDEKLGKIPGAAPILHYFYPHLPKKVLKPFKPVVDLRQAGILGALTSGNKALNALGLNPFEDLVDDVFGGGKDDEKLGKIPGAAPILHYFYPYLPKKVLKPFKPLVDVRMAQMVARNEMSQRLLELKYAAAARAAAKSRYQQRLMEAMGMPSLRRGRQLDPDSDLDSAVDEAADSSLDHEGEENLDFSKESTGDKHEETENESLGEENADISAGDLFAGQSKNPLAQAFRFFLPELGIEDVDMEKAAKGHTDILENPEVMGEDARIGRALDIIQQSIIDNAPFPMNKIYSEYMSIRFPKVAARQQRSLKASFNESLANLRKLQLKSLALNDSFAAEVNSSKAQRTGRQLGDILGAALPFPFNLLLSFLPQANSGQHASGLDSASLDGLGGDAEATLSESDGDGETEGLDGGDLDSALRSAGLSGSESDRRMAAMVGTVLPAPLDALVTMVAPFRSLEQELENESNTEEGNSSEAQDQVLKSFQNSLQAIHDQYVSKQDSVSSHDGNSDKSTQALAMQALSSV